MTYRIAGLPRAQFEPYFAMTEAELAKRWARRVVADSGRGFPCRVSLEDAAAGESLILLHHVSNDVEGPFRMAHAIYVRVDGGQTEVFVDRTPPVFAGRTLSFRAFDAAGSLIGGSLAQPVEHDSAIRSLLVDPAVDHLDAHNAAYGCFAARIERCRDAA